MRLVSFILILAFAGSAFSIRGVKRQIDPPPTKNAYKFEDQWFPQKLDHFDITGSPLWNQRYWVNMEHYQEGGPAFIHIGGEAEARPTWLEFGLWHTLAEQHNAALFILEHRYYGKSEPTSDMSTENMKYLSSRQALEDLATFMANMTVTYNITRPRPWISFGGSYPGSLSAWLKLKYPHLMSGAVSSSGPLFAKVDFFEYLGVVHDAIRDHSHDCMHEGVEKAIAEITALIESNGLEEVGSLFKTCNPIDASNENDIKSLMELLIDNLAGVVQYDGRLQTSIADVCDIMEDANGGRAIDRFATLNSVLLEQNGEECLDHEFSTFVNDISDTTWAEKGGFRWRPWLWQTCTEFGWYQTTNQDFGKPFGSSLDLDFFVSWCSLAFPEAKIDKEALEEFMIATNAEYGGFTPDINNVVYVHGSVDPWHAMGVLEDLSESAPAIYIPGTSHCADMYDDTLDDPIELLAARQQIMELVAKWLA